MKKFTLIMLASCIAVAAMAQLKPSFPDKKNMKQAIRPAKMFKNEDAPGIKPSNPVVANKPMEMHPSTMMTRYDLQTNSSNQNRVYYFEDGTIGVTANFRNTDNDATRGSGYNYFDGMAWGPKPTTRIEATKAGFPSYDKFGPTGEIVVSHHMTDGLYVHTRAVKGTGTWNESILAGPPEAIDISWPRVVTNGPDNTNIHIIAVTYQLYLGMDYALLYYRSTDGGASWDIQNQQIEGLTSNEYLTFSADVYTWAEPRGDTLCFTVGDSWLDQIIVKSTDNGANWTITKIWSNPYPKWDGTTLTDWFYAPDGNSAIALDKNGKAHVTFGLQYVYGDETGSTYWTPNCDGLIYWNEDMPEITSLDPLNLPDNQYIGWVADTTVYSQPETEFAYYYNSLSSMPTLAVDNDDKVFAIWTSVTNYRDVNNYMFRHLYARGSLDGGATWRDTIVDLTSDFDYRFEEAAYPTVSPTCINDTIFIMFQGDPEAGAVNKTAAQGQASPTDNELRFIRAAKNDIMQVGVGIKEPAEKVRFTVSQNAPNPFRGATTVTVNTQETGSLTVELFSILGKSVFATTKTLVSPGSHQVILDGSGMAPGTYFYKVTINGQSITKKMMVE
ncbi:MAG: T9SS type A sorting domain-containing protein [bacterium]